MTGACKIDDLAKASGEPSPTIQPRPTDIPPQPTIIYEATATPEPKPTSTPQPQLTETVLPEEKIFLIPGTIYPKEFGTETIAGFLARGDNDYYRPIEKEEGREDYVQKVYQFLLVNFEVLEPLLAETELSRGKTLGDLAAVSGKNSGEILRINKDQADWREQVVSNLASFRVFEGTTEPLHLEVPWPELPLGGEEFNRPPEKNEFKIEKEKVGETALGSTISLEIFRQDDEDSWKGKPIIWIIGGIHPGERTGDENGNGWLALVKKYFKENQEIWQGSRIAFLDPNFDGQGRLNPDKVNLQRNFGGPECPSCLWDENEITEGALCSSSGRPGKGPNSEPESQAIIKAAEFLLQYGEVQFCTNLHSAANLVESGACMDRGLNCEITELLAEKMGIPYLPRWDRYSCGFLHGEPDEYLRQVYGIPVATIEFSKVSPSEEEAGHFCRALLEAVEEVYSIK